MKILLAVDGSRHSQMAVRMLVALKPGPDAKVTLMTVVPEHAFLGGITIDTLRRSRAALTASRKEQRERATELLREPQEALQALGVNVDTEVRWGRPDEQIVKKAHDIMADLVVVGAKGHGGRERCPLGGVAQRVIKYAHCSVLLCREEISSFRRVVLATDGSKYSDAAIKFLLDLPLPRSSELFVISVLQSHIATWLKMPTLSLEANQKLLGELQQEEERAASILTSKTRKLLADGGYRASSMVLRGDPAEEILMVASTLNPELIVLGAKGLGGVERFLLGNVTQRVARYAAYSVLIVRQKNRSTLT